jgi:hypothetical protein
MGTITRSFANNITTSGVLLPASLTNNSIANVTAYNAAIATGGIKLISSQTANNSASISFTTGIDSAYKEYQFWFVNIHPRTDEANFQVNFSTDSGSNYNTTKTSSAFRVHHDEADTDTAFDYTTSFDLAQSTDFKPLSLGLGNGGDDNLGGTLQLFNPSSTTYVKHFIGNINQNYRVGAPFSINHFTAGYGNTTSAINAVQFKMTTGNFDGTILLYGIV